MGSLEKPREEIFGLERGFSLEFEENAWDSEWMIWKKLVFKTLTDQYANNTAFYLNKFFQILTVVNLITYALETKYTFMDAPWKRNLWYALDLAALIIFSFEYFARIIFIPNYKMLPKLMISTGWIIDLVSLLPFYIQFFFYDYTSISYLGILRLSRLLRLYRFFNLNSAPRQSQIFVLAFLRSKDALSMLSFVIVVIVLVFSTLIYYAEMSIERPLNGLWIYTSGPNAGSISPFQNIVDSIWFTVETCSVVGYGDVVPSSVLGKIVAAFIAMGGLFMLAFPISILGIRMNEVYSDFLKRDTAKRHLRERIVPLKKRVKWNIEELSQEQEELVRLMLENLYEIEDTIKKYKRIIEISKTDMFFLRQSIASFGGEQLKKYAKIDKSI